MSVSAFLNQHKNENLAQQTKQAIEKLSYLKLQGKNVRCLLWFSESCSGKMHLVGNGFKDTRRLGQRTQPSQISINQCNELNDSQRNLYMKKLELISLCQTRLFISSLLRTHETFLHSQVRCIVQVKFCLMYLSFSMRNRKVQSTICLALVKTYF